MNDCVSIIIVNTNCRSYLVEILKQLLILRCDNELEVVVLDVCGQTRIKKIVNYFGKNIFVKYIDCSSAKSLTYIFNYGIKKSQFSKKIILSTDIFKSQSFFCNCLADLFAAKFEKKMIYVDAQSSNINGASATLYTPYGDKLNLNVAFVIPNESYSSRGHHSHILANLLARYGVTSCVVPSRNTLFNEGREYTLVFPDGRGPDIVHAWTLQESVRQVCESLLDKNNVRLVIHIDKDEEKIARIAYGNDRIISYSDSMLNSIYHPLPSRIFLEKACGFTFENSCLDFYNIKNVAKIYLNPTADERLFHPQPINYCLRKKLKIPDNSFVVCCCFDELIFDIDYLKNIIDAIECLNKKNIKTILFVINNQGSMSKDIISYGKYIRIFNFVSNGDKAQLYATANVFISLKLKSFLEDNFIPSEVPEYFAMGKPVIFLKNTKINFMEPDLNGYVLSDGTTDDIVKCISEILTSTSSSLKIGLNGIQFFRSFFYDSQSGENLFNFYKYIM